MQNAQANNPSIDNDQVLVTLQKGQSIAVCQFGWGTWSSIATSGVASFTTADRCDIPGQP
jgi:hypothetical protein